MDIYVVQPGDTIEEIANMYEITVEKLIRDNELVNPDNLLVGQTIIIVHPSETYMVSEGDTLEAIAADNNIRVGEILRNNPFLADREYIYPGEELAISFNRTASFSTYGYANIFINRDTLRKTLPYLTYLSIYNYQIGNNGEALGSDDDIDIIQTAIEYGVIPLMHLAAISLLGEFDVNLTYRLLNDEVYQDTLFENVINVLRDKEYYGIIISAQYITTENQDLFLNYTRRFSERLSQDGYLTLIAINPKVNTLDDEVVYEDIDYSKFSDVVYSILFLQYTWGILDTPPAPVISISNLSVFIDSIQTQIDADKISIGIPVLGYMWELPYVAGFSSSNILSRDNVYNLAINVGATIQFDEVSQTPFFIFENTSNNSIQYIVWYIYAITFDSLMRLLIEKGIASTSVWNIMSYFAQLWLVINSQYKIVKLLPEP
ncbi:MAG: LysM peptidoglycan-binding domain-containing protein [Herbinix sp.]|nr:LysM peptidoglycan-binding domain-containing protein [Herbinix sp.]